MKKIIIALFTFFPIFAYGENMCVKDGSIMVILDPQIAGTTSSYDTTSGTWSVQFGYGVVSGIVGCSGTNLSAGVVVTGAVTSTNGYCRCKMLRPVESIWVAANSGGWCGSGDQCKQNCSSACASVIKSNLDMRKGLFGNPVQ